MELGNRLTTAHRTSLHWGCDRASVPGMTDEITRLYRACPPDEALPANDPRYVDCDDARGNRVAPLMARGIRLADPSKPEYKLLTGHRGVGKSTEVRRVGHLLENPQSGEKRFKAIFFDITDELEVADLEMADLLVVTAAQVQKQLQAMALPGFSVTTEYLKKVWDDFRQLCGNEVSLSEVEGELLPGILKVTAELKAGAPSSRQALRTAIEKQSVSLRRALNDLLESARVALHNNGWEGLVILVDGLDKVPFDRQEHIFNDRCDQLVGLAAHVVYTVPISLAYNPRFSETAQTFGETCSPVPMIHLEKDNPNGKGWRTLEEMIDKRCAAAKVDPTKLFDSTDTRRHLCALTGGHPRHLCMFLQSSLNRVDQLPVRKADVDDAVRNYTDSLAREIPSECWPWLRKFADGSLTTLPADMPDTLRRSMLYWLYIFEYRNGEPFYDVNPVIRRLKKFQSD